MQFNNRLLPAADVACALGVHADANTATGLGFAPLQVLCALRPLNMLDTLQMQPAHADKP